MMHDFKNMDVPLPGEEVIDFSTGQLMKGDMMRYKYPCDVSGVPHVVMGIVDSAPEDTDNGKQRTIWLSAISATDPHIKLGTMFEIIIPNRAKPIIGYVRPHNVTPSKLTPNDWRRQVAVTAKTIITKKGGKNKKIKIKNLLIHLTAAGYLENTPVFEDSDTQSGAYKSASKRVKDALQQFPEEFLYDSGGVKGLSNKAWDSPYRRREGGARITVREKNVRLGFSKFADGFMLLLDAFNMIEIISVDDEIGSNNTQL